MKSFHDVGSLRIKLKVSCKMSSVREIKVGGGGSEDEKT